MATKLLPIGIYPEQLPGSQAASECKVVESTADYYSLADFSEIV